MTTPTQTRPDQSQRRQTRRLVILMFLRLVLGVGVVLLVYALLPMGGDQWWSAVIPLLVIGTCVFTYVFVHGLRRIISGRHPAIEAVETMVLTILVVIVVFATIAVDIEAQWPGSYSEGLTKIDGIYFSVTTIATVGYGDITPVTEGARLATVVQMLANLAVLGLAVRLLTRALSRSQASRGSDHLLAVTQPPNSIQGSGTKEDQ